MQSDAQTRSVSGNLYKAVRILRLHRKVRPISTGNIEARFQRESSTTQQIAVLGNPDTQHLYMSRGNYEVASSRVLGSMGRLDTDLPASSLGDSSSGFDSPTPNSMIFRAKGFFSRQSNIVRASPKGEKVHGKLCRMKSMVKKALHCSKTVGVCRTPENTLLSGSYSTSTDRSVRAEDKGGNKKSTTSVVLDDPPQVAPLLPVSKLLPELTINISGDDETTSPIAAEHDRSNEEDEIHDEVFRVAPLHLRSPKLNSVPSNRASEGDATLYYTHCAKTKDDVFSTPDGDSLEDCPVSKLMIELRKVMEQTSYDGVVTPLLASTALQMANRSLSPKVRHTSISSVPMLSSDSLQSQYSVSEFESSPPSLKASAIRNPEDKEVVKNLRIAPSLEKGLCANDLEVYEENIVAVAAPIIRGVYPGVIDVRHTKLYETYERQDHAARPSSRTTFSIVFRFVVRVDERNEVAFSIEWSSKWGFLPVETKWYTNQTSIEVRLIGGRGNGGIEAKVIYRRLV